MMKNRPSDCPSDYNIELAKSDGPGGQGTVIAVVGDSWAVRTVVGLSENGSFDPKVDMANGLVCAVDDPFPDSEQPLIRVKGHVGGLDRISNATNPDRTNSLSDSVDVRHHPSLCNGSSSNGTHPTTTVRRISRSASLGSDHGSETEDWRRASRRGDADGACDPALSVTVSSDNGGGGVRRSSMPDACTADSAPPDVANAPYSLSAVLENIPLAYDPRTRQLRLITSTRAPSTEDDDDSNNNKSDDAASCQRPRTTGTPGNANASPAGRTSPAEVQLRSKTKSESSSTVGRHSADGCGETGQFLGLLQRVPTSGSLQSRAECCSSVSSISSLSTDVSFSAASSVFNDDGGAAGSGHEVLPPGGRSGNAYLLLDSDEAGFIEINLDQRHHGRGEQHHYQQPPASGSPDSASGRHSNDEESGEGNGAKLKRRGLSGLLNRSLLPWKSTRTPNLLEDVDAPGWKLFGIAPLRHTANRDPNKIIEEYHARQRQLSAEQSANGNTTPKSKKGNGLVASSTTALILENRPLNLPAKDPDEELKHRLEYEQMVEFAKRREIKEAKQKKKQMQQQLKHEEQLFLASKVWNSEILPNWETTKQSRKTKELWWQGIPPSVRGKVWKLAIGNDLHITPELYEICVCRAKDRIRMAAEMISVSEEDCNEEGLADKEGSVELIKLDVSRSFPQLCIFQKGGPYYDMLHSLLGAYVCYRPDVGYVQGMSFLAAVLILNLEVADAFICFANLLNQPCQLAFFRLDEPMMRSYFSTYEEFFKENMPKLFSHFGKQNLSADLYLIDWIYTLYSRSLPLDVASRVWDVFFRDGDEFLFRTALGILRLYEDILLQLDFIHLAQFLTKLPEDIAPEPLFKSIESVKMICDKRTFAQVLLHHSDSSRNT